MYGMVFIPFGAGDRMHEVLESCKKELIEYFGNILDELKEEDRDTRKMIQDILSDVGNLMLENSRLKFELAKVRGEHG